MHGYTAYGLYIQSTFPMPELRQVEEAPGADVLVYSGSVPAHLDEVAGRDAYYQANTRQFLLHVPNVASYLVQDGKEIVVQRVAHSHDAEVRLFLLGSCLGALLQQRGMLVLHASAVVTPAGAVLFLGHSGAGKSTLLHAFVQHGYPMLCDDVASITVDDAGGALVVPGYPGTKLWHDAAERLQQSVASLPTIRPGMPKYRVAIPEAQFATAPARLACLYVLEPGQGSAVALSPLERMHALAAVVTHTYRGHFLDALGQRVTHFHRAGAVLNQAAVVRVARPDLPHYMLDELVATLEEDIARRASMSAVACSPAYPEPIQLATRDMAQ